jgi:hypothetical protein
MNYVYSSEASETFLCVEGGSHLNKLLFIKSNIFKIISIFKLDSRGIIHTARNFKGLRCTILKLYNVKIELKFIDL